MKALATTAAVLGLAAAAAAPAQAGNGGAPFESTPAEKKPDVHKPSKLGARPVLAKFSVTPSVLAPGAAPAAAFLIKGRKAQIRIRLVVSWPGTTTPERIVDLGRQPTGTPLTLPLMALADPALPEGPLQIRIAGRDTAGRLLRPAARLSRIAQIEVRGHVFPLVGPFSYGDAGARFGAARNGHSHQGQDLLAAEGSPVFAVRAGTIEYIGYQKEGAGWYVVLDGDDEDFDYAFMHLKEDSIPVVKGQHVSAGQRIGGVGHTGDAQGNHLHFEVWDGPWFAGGQAIDPLPLLQLWQMWSDATTLE